MKNFLAFPFSSEFPVKVTENEGKLVFARHEHPLVFAPLTGLCKAFLTGTEEPLQAVVLWLEEHSLYIVMSGFTRLDAFLPKQKLASPDFSWSELLLPVDTFITGAKQFRLGDSLGSMNLTLDFQLYVVRDDALVPTYIAAQDLFEEDTGWHPKYVRS